MNGKPRKPLKRYTELKRVPLARGDYQLKRTGRLKPMSDKKRQEIAETSPIRAAYRKSVVGCAVHLFNHGGLIEPVTGLHELMGGTTRADEVTLPQFWTPLCDDCHDEVQSVVELRELVVAAKTLGDWYSIAYFQERAKKKQIDIKQIAKLVAERVGWKVEEKK